MAELDLNPISLQILMGRLVAIADEAATTLHRTAFSQIVREGFDFACALTDPSGQSLALSSMNPPMLLATLPRTVRSLLGIFPLESLRPGDMLISNDQWMGTGHYNDIVVVFPVFKEGRVIAFSASLAHAIDIGGCMSFMIDTKEVFEEGLHIPACKLYSESRENETVFAFLRENVRQPDEVIGDLLAQAAANRLAARRLLEFADEYGLRDLDELAAKILAGSETATCAAIRELPAGTYRDRMLVEGAGANGSDVEVVLALTVDHERGVIVCDFAGSSPQQPNASNVKLNYGYGIVFSTLRCVLGPEIPNNEGCYRKIIMNAPEGSILNPKFPAAGGARHLVGHLLAEVLYNALGQAAPERVRAAAGARCFLMLYGERDDGSRFGGLYHVNGGMGGASGQDGLSCMSFPSNGFTTSHEVFEQANPVRFIRRELRTDSGGAGQWRGGLGQTVEIEVTGPTATCVANVARARYPAPGLEGGLPGTLAGLWLCGERVSPLGNLALKRGDRIRFDVSGGGGFGDPATRDLAPLNADIEDGYVSQEAARSVYVALAGGRPAYTSAGHGAA